MTEKKKSKKRCTGFKKKNLKISTCQYFYGETNEVNRTFELLDLDTWMIEDLEI